MAVNTASAWTEKRAGYGGNSLYVAECTVLAAVANRTCATLKTPRGLNVKRPWTLYFITSADPDAGDTVTLSLWGGWSDDFVMTNTSGLTTAAATDGGKILQLCDNFETLLKTLSGAFHFTPNSYPYGGVVADVVAVSGRANGFKVRIPVMPYYAFVAQSGSVLDAHTETFKIIQL